MPCLSHLVFLSLLVLFFHLVQLRQSARVVYHGLLYLVILLVEDGDELAVGARRHADAGFGEPLVAFHLGFVLGLIPTFVSITLLIIRRGLQNC